MYINFWYPAEWGKDVTDQPVKVRMLGQDFVLFRDSAGDAHCLSNTCIHRGGSLAGGKITGDCIQCPYHGWQFDGDGQCQRMPSLGPDAPSVPTRARVDSYPTEERYGIIFAFLGDLPAAERPPILEIPEFDMSGWYAQLSGGHFTDGDYRRYLDNALDPAHNEYVHPTHGFSGANDDYRVPELTVEDTEWGCGFLTTYYAPPLKDEKMQAATGRSEPAIIKAGTFVHGPCDLCTKIHPTAEMSIHQYGYKVPVDKGRSRSFLVQCRNFLLGEEHDQRFLDRNKVVRDQDITVLDDLNPVFTPPTNEHEFLLPADAAIVRYRERLDEWEARGWRIDMETVERESPHKAFAIPSPARREQPTGWVLDTVPMLPAKRAAESATTRRSGAGG